MNGFSISYFDGRFGFQRPVIVTGRKAQPSKHRTCPEKCADLGHPGVTYNPLCGRTWCLCGEVTYEEPPLTVEQHLACCNGPLTEPTNP